MSFESHLQAIPYREEKVGNAIDQIFLLGGGGNGGKGSGLYFLQRLIFFLKADFGILSFYYKNVI